MKEIGGYIELDTYRLPMLHENSIKLNCGRNALWYLVKTREIKKIWMPKFMCGSCNAVFKIENVEVEYYSIGLDFKPINIQLLDDEWLYIVNYYGQLTNEYISYLKIKYRNIIVDNAQSYFQMPVENTDTIYTCRKFFGVADGAILYSDTETEIELEQDESFKRMNFLLGRYERNASEFYSEYATNNNFFENEPIKVMSKLTNNLLHGIDYEFVRNQRTENFKVLDSAFNEINKLNITVPVGPFMYPLYIENGASIRKKLQTQKIYIPTLWPDVFELCNESDLEYQLAKNILPLPVDQRYTQNDMNDLSEIIKTLIN